MSRRRNRQSKSGTSSANNEENQVVEDVVIGGEDRLSDLPECVLTDILSRIPTRDAIQTCVLSKKWEFRWTKIYNLEFDDIYFRTRGRNTRERFSYYVDRVLMHNRSTSLQKFSLHCSSVPAINYDSNRIHTWITAALRRNVKILLIDTRSESAFMPRCTAYDTLKLKELTTFSTITIRVPDDVLFSTLTKIDLNQVVLLGKSDNHDAAGAGGAGGAGGAPAVAYTGGELVVLKLPLLEYFNMSCCEWRNVNGVKFDVPKLTSFNMTILTQNYLAKDLLEKFVFTVCGGSKLTDIKLSGNLLENYDFSPTNNPLSPIQNVSIKVMFLPRNWPGVGTRITVTLKQMSTLRFLEFSGETIVALKHAAQTGNFLPFFANLIHLKLHTTDYWFTDGAVFVSIIRCAPVLHTLTVEMDTTAGNDLQYYASTSTQGDGIIPNCFRSHLKVVQFISTFNCLKKEKDTNLIKFILENTSVLEQFQFIDPYNRRSVPCSKIRNLVLRFPRASSVAQVVFM